LAADEFAKTIDIGGRRCGIECRGSGRPRRAGVGPRRGATSGIGRSRTPRRCAWSEVHPGLRLRPAGHRTAPAASQG
jgi:hypothetical protein